MLLFRSNIFWVEKDFMKKTALFSNACCWFEPRLRKYNYKKYFALMELWEHYGIEFPSASTKMPPR